MLGQATLSSIAYFTFVINAEYVQHPISSGAHQPMTSKIFATIDDAILSVAERLGKSGVAI